MILSDFQVFRQSDPEFIAVLEKIRRGICDQKCIDLFASCGSELRSGGAIQIRVSSFRSLLDNGDPDGTSSSQPTNLYPRRQAVDDENRREFKNLKEEEYVFKADDQSRGDWGATQLKRVISTSVTSIR